ncbi:hypothetical protein SDRG_13639 [Saprolegnia diclina VS20]|uniref:WW domain-containing protein n=1 Tax=Saprolegnia diclina (strain VS20) TaxID=1156394 RepID=T0Q1Z4_SAPDV|nr:hypothetical protein SDRG_13639 [Saprolegnia diclina VS20]EQC28561.1 hypothetical protein SDRG_13639 [Saprolegnia diclina VS20]|eukprot:XP_008617958.1 hypothetical protein SDRG_13639 [Saprolegnia diclina VS20]
MSTTSSSSNASFVGKPDGKVAAPKQKIRGSPPTSAPELSQLGTKAGFLRKEADNEKGHWTPYYFVVKPSTFLYYYRTPTDEYPRGVIDLEYMTDVRLNSQCIKRSIGGSAHSFRVAADVKTTEQKKIRPLYLDIAPEDAADEIAGETPAQRQARMEAHAIEWMKALQGHRYKTIDSEKEDLQEEVRTLKDKCEKTQEAIVRLTEQLDHITRRSKYVVKEAMAATQAACGALAEPESYEALAPSLDALGSIAKLASLVEELATHVHARNDAVKVLQAEIEDEREKNTPVPSSPMDDDDEPADELNHEILEQVLDDSQGTISSKQFSAMRNKGRGFSSNASSTQMLSAAGSAFNLGFSKAKAVTSRLAIGSKLKRQLTTAPQTPTKAAANLPKGWIARESSSTPGTFYYVNETTGETSWDVPVALGSPTVPEGDEDNNDDDTMASEPLDGDNNGDNKTKWKLNKPAFSRTFSLKPNADGAVKEIDRSHHQF